MSAVRQGQVSGWPRIVRMVSRSSALAGTATFREDKRPVMSLLVGLRATLTDPLDQGIFPMKRIDRINGIGVKVSILE